MKYAIGEIIFWFYSLATKKKERKREKMFFFFFFYLHRFSWLTRVIILHDHSGLFMLN